MAKKQEEERITGTQDVLHPAFTPRMCRICGYHEHVEQSDHGSGTLPRREAGPRILFHPALVGRCLDVPKTSQPDADADEAV